jgi:hypothetical protein
VTRDTRIARPRFRHAQIFGDACGFTAPCCAIPMYNRFRLSSPRNPAAGLFDSIESQRRHRNPFGMWPCFPELLRDFYHRSLRLLVPEAATANATHSMGAKPRRQSEGYGLTQADVEAKKGNELQCGGNWSPFPFPLLVVPRARTCHRSG